MANLSKKDKFDFDFDSRPKKYRGIDLVKVKKKSHHKNKNTKNKQRGKFLWLWLLTIALIFLLSSFFLIKFTQKEFKLLQFLKAGKYLVLFQNNAEIRPSGGFIGSFAVVTFENYKIKNVNLNTNIYKLDSAYTADHVIEPPEPLQIFNNGRWCMRDSNFAVSFPEAAEKVEWFYGQESGEKVDGVIAVNASLVRDILKVVGPIHIASTNTEINAGNFFTELTKIIELQYYQTGENQIVNEPKSVLTEMFPQLMSKIKTGPKIKLTQIGLNALKNKDVMIYLNRRDLQQEILAKNWGGEVQNSSSDYLNVNNANLGGHKPSQNIVENLDYNVRLVDNVLTSTLIVNQTHIGNGAWPDGDSHNWTRILVPLGSTLNKALLNDKDVTALTQVGYEAGKTYFAYYLDTLPGSSAKLQLDYQLPISPNNYHLLLQKQSGTPGDAVEIKYENKILFNGILDEDKVIK